MIRCLDLYKTASGETWDESPLGLEGIPYFGVQNGKSNDE